MLTPTLMESVTDRSLIPLLKTMCQVLAMANAGFTPVLIPPHEPLWPLLYSSSPIDQDSLLACPNEIP